MLNYWCVERVFC